MKPSIRCNDNIAELKKIPDASVDLVYIDPPFNSNRDWDDFNDKWESMDSYIEFMKPRIAEIHRILKPTGSMFMHVDSSANAYLRVATDRIFGQSSMVNEITWRRSRPKRSTSRLSNVTDTIYWFAKSNKFTFNPLFKSLSPGSNTRYDKVDTDGRRYMERTITAPGSMKTWAFGIGEKQPRPGRGYSWSKERIEDGIKKGILYPGTAGFLVTRRYMNESKGSPVTNLWDDIHHVMSRESLQYATQKPEKLIERVISTSSNPGDTVLDAFAGSGTTCAVAKRLGRKSICIDQNPKACKIMKTRLE